MDWNTFAMSLLTYIMFMLMTRYCIYIFDSLIGCIESSLKSHGKNLLHYACEKGRKGIALMLIGKGVDEKVILSIFNCIFLQMGLFVSFFLFFSLPIFFFRT